MSPTRSPREQSRGARVALALLLLAPATAARAETDDWLGADKALHFSLSAAGSLAGYGAATAFSDEPAVRLAYGASVSLLAGLGKELWDASGHGAPSLKDFAWDVLGAAVGVAIGWLLDRWLGTPGPASVVAKPVLDL